jgi:hypothetical protein
MTITAIAVMVIKSHDHNRNCGDGYQSHDHNRNCGDGYQSHSRGCGYAAA